MIIGKDETLLTLNGFSLLEKTFELMKFNRVESIESHLDEVKLLIINGNLNVINGIDFIEYIREKDFDTPIIFLSENLSTDEIERTFAMGADDCLVKPFTINELICRIKAILKRTYGITHERLIHRDIILDINSRQTYVGEAEIELTKLEFDLLTFFIENKNSILKQDDILDKIWEGSTTKKRTINVRISRLNHKIDPENIKGYFTAIRGVGYRFD